MYSHLCSGRPQLEREFIQLPQAVGDPRKFPPICPSSLCGHILIFIKEPSRSPTKFSPFMFGNKCMTSSAFSFHSFQSQILCSNELGFSSLIHPHSGPALGGVCKELPITSLPHNGPPVLLPSPPTFFLAISISSPWDF